MVRTDRGDAFLTANEVAMDALDIDHLFAGEDDDSGDLLDDVLLNFDVDELEIDDLPAPEAIFDYVSMGGGMTNENPEMLKLPDGIETKLNTGTAQAGYVPDLGENIVKAASTKKGATRKNTIKKSAAASEFTGSGNGDGRYYHQVGRGASNRTRYKKSQYADINTSTVSSSLPKMQSKSAFDIGSVSSLKRKSKNKRSLPTQKKRKSLTGNGHDETSQRNASTMGRMSSFHERSRNFHTARETNLAPPLEHQYAFYPFMDTSPNGFEPLHTIYPNLYRIFSSSSPEGATTSSQQNENANPILNLLYNFVGTEVEISQGQFDPNDEKSLKTRDIHVLADEASINKSKNYMSENIEKKVLVQELRSLLDKVKSQRAFLTKQTCQMTHFCKDNFNGAQNGVPSSPDFFASTADYAQSVGVSQHVIGKVINAANPIALSLKVKIKCVGFKKPDTAPLDAVMIPMKGTNPSLVSCGVPIIQAQKKARPTLTKRPSVRKKKEKSAPPPPPPRPILKPKKPAKPYVVKIKKRTFDEKSPEEKHKIIAKILKEKSAAFEQHVVKADAKRQRELKARNEKLAGIIDQHTDREMASDQFWEMVPLFAYWDEKSKEEIDNDLSTVWQPELSKRAMQWSEPPTPVIMKSQKSENSLSAKQDVSLFNRLQSLLVDEGESDEEDESNDENNGEVSDDDSPSEVESRDQRNRRLGFVDLSGLSLDQRAYIHLRAAHLLDQPLLKSLVPAVVERSDISDIDGLNRDEMFSVISRKQMELSKLHRASNSKLSHLRSVSLEKISKDRIHGTTRVMDTQKNRTVEVDADEWVPP